VVMGASLDLNTQLYFWKIKVQPPTSDLMKFMLTNKKANLGCAALQIKFIV